MSHSITQPPAPPPPARKAETGGSPLQPRPWSPSPPSPSCTRKPSRNTAVSCFSWRWELCPPPALSLPALAPHASGSSFLRNLRAKGQDRRRDGEIRAGTQDSPLSPKEGGRREERDAGVFGVCLLSLCLSHSSPHPSVTHTCTYTHI